MWGVRLSVRNDAGELGAVETFTEDDFMFFRDSVYLALENGKFASRFPILFKTFFSDWQSEDVPALERELRAIHAAFRTMPPEPPDGNWRAKLRQSGRTPETLAEVYVDKDGAPLLERLIALAQTAREHGLPIQWGSPQPAEGESEGPTREQLDQLLLESVGTGELEIARAALDSGASPNARTDGREESADRMWSHTPALYTAATRGDAAMVKLLLYKGANPNAEFERRGMIDFETRPVLVDALQYPVIVEMLLQAGADPNKPSIWGEDCSNPTSPLEHARDNPDMQALLKSHGAK